MPTSMYRRLSLAAASGAVLALAATGTLPAAAADRGAGRLVTVERYDFTAGNTPENIAFAPDGTRYVTLAFGGRLEIAPRRGPGRILDLPGAGSGTVTGGVVVAASGRVFVAVSSPDPARAGVWEVHRDDTVTRFAALPSAGAHNGMAIDRAGALFVADSQLGQVYRIPTRGSGSGAAKVWIKDPALDPDPTTSLEGIPFPGANGIKVFRGAVYVSNSARAAILRVPIRRDGSPGRLQVAYPGVVADDFAFDVRGDLYTTTDPFQTVNRIAPDGTTTVLATREDGLDGPSAVAFGVGRERTTLYVTELGLFGATHDSKVQKLRVGVPGARVR